MKNKSMGEKTETMQGNKSFSPPPQKKAINIFREVKRFYKNRMV